VVYTQHQSGLRSDANFLANARRSRTVICAARMYQRYFRLFQTLMASQYQIIWFLCTMVTTNYDDFDLVLEGRVSKRGEKCWHNKHGLSGNNLFLCRKHAYICIFGRMLGIYKVRVVPCAAWSTGATIAPVVPTRPSDQAVGHSGWPAETNRQFWTTSRSENIDGNSRTQNCKCGTLLYLDICGTLCTWLISINQPRLFSIG
jgi:hypothetical protein